MRRVSGNGALQSRPVRDDGSCMLEDACICPDCDTDRLLLRPAQLHERRRVRKLRRGLRLRRLLRRGRVPRQHRHWRPPRGGAAEPARAAPAGSATPTRRNGRPVIDFTGRVVLVTGASKGIGAAAARLFGSLERASRSTTTGMTRGRGGSAKRSASPAAARRPPSAPTSTAGRPPARSPSPPSPSSARSITWWSATASGNTRPSAR